MAVRKAVLDEAYNFQYPDGLNKSGGVFQACFKGRDVRRERLNTIKASCVSHFAILLHIVDVLYTHLRIMGFGTCHTGILFVARDVRGEMRDAKHFLKRLTSHV
jgi:hypothetical protein